MSSSLSFGGLRVSRADGPSSSVKASRLDTLEMPQLQFESDGRKRLDVPVGRQSGLGNFLFLGGKWWWGARSTDWMRPTHIGESSLLYSLH